MSLYTRSTLGYTPISGSYQPNSTSIVSAGTTQYQVVFPNSGTITMTGMAPSLDKAEWTVNFMTVNPKIAALRSRVERLEEMVGDIEAAEELYRTMRDGE